jgi:hypothetical protein
MFEPGNDMDNFLGCNTKKVEKRFGNSQQGMADDFVKRNHLKLTEFATKHHQYRPLVSFIWITKRMQFCDM